MSKYSSLHRFYLEGLPRKKIRAVTSAITGNEKLAHSLTPSQVHHALEIHSKTGLPLRMALELEVGRTKNPLAINTARRLQSSYTITTPHGTIRITPSFSTMSTVTETSSKGIQRFGLHHFTTIAFRVTPSERERNRFSNTQNFVQIFEIGFAKIGKKTVIVVTNAQAKKVYYSLPWPLKKMFKGAYEKTLEIIQQASGGLPIIIPTNQTVKNLIQTLFGHSPTDKILDEFYDKFCEKRGRKKTILTIKNPNDGKKLTAEFWINKPLYPTLKKAISG